MLFAWKGNDLISFFLFEIDGELFLEEVTESKLTCGDRKAELVSSTVPQ